MTLGSLFAGIGGIDLGFERAGFTPAWQVEIDPFCRKVLEKHWPNVRRHDDVKTFPPEGDWSVDVIAGGFPCQDISNAGNREGIKEGTRSGLWAEFAKIISVVRPRIVVVENVAALLGLGMGRVCGDLARLGFDAEWSIVSACAMGAPHTRERLFIIAYRHEIGRGRVGYGNERANEVCSRFNAWETAPSGQWRDVERWIVQTVETGGQIIPAAERGGMADGVPDRLDRIAACGNSVVPQIAEFIARRILAAEAKS